MPYVESLTETTAPETSRPILKSIEEKFGQSLNLFNVMAHQPDVLGGVTQVNEGIHRDLPDRLRELAYYLASHINDCGYCSHYHKMAAKKAGVSEQQLAEIGNFLDSDAFDDIEKAVLSYSQQLTRTATVDETTVTSLKKVLDDKQMVALAATVALANFTNRFNHGLDIQLP